MTTDFIPQLPDWRLIARHARTLGRLAACLLLMSCHTDQTGPGPVARLQIAPTSLDLMLNEIAQVVAIPRDAEGTMVTGRPVTWTSQDPLVATVTAFGRVTGISIGRTTVVAMFDGLTAEVPVSVIAATGEVEIFVNKIGSAADPQGLLLLLDGQPLGEPLATVGRRLVGLPVGMHTVRLEGIESRCELIGEASRVVFVVTRQRVAMTFNVACQLSGQLVVKTQTVGQRSVSAPYRFTLDDSASVDIDPNDELRIELRAGRHRVALSTQDARCLVDTGHQEVGVFEGIISAIAFQVRCYAEPPSLKGSMLVVSYRPSISGPFNESTSGSGLYAMDPEGTLRFPLDDGPAGAGDAAVSSDGRRLAFRQFATNASHLVVLDVATGTRSVSANALRISGLSWSPDGQRLVTGLSNGESTSLVVLRADGSLERNLGQSDDASLSAHWSPDGSTIAFTRRNHEVLLVNPDGTNLRALKTSSTEYFDGGDWSPDGRTLLVRSFKQWCYYYSSYYCYTFDARLLVLDVAAGREIRRIPIADYAFGFVWGATSEDVYFIQAGDVFYTRLDGFGPINVTRSPEDEWSVLWGHFEGSPATATRRRR